MKDYYLILGIEPNSTLEEIKKAYRQMSLKYHPDKNKGDKYFEERFKDVLEAYNTLIDIEKRKAYDYQWLSYFSGLSNERSKLNSQQEENLRKREKIIFEKEEALKKRESDIKTKENIVGGNDSTKTDLKANSILWLFIIFIIIVIGFSIINSQKTNKVVGGNLVDTIRNVSSESDTVKAPVLQRNKIDSNSSKKEVKNAFLSDLTGPNSKKSHKIVKTYRGKALLFNTYLKNDVEVDILNLKWDDNYDPENGERALSSVSIRNKTDKTVASTVVSYDVFNSSGLLINSGEFIINPSYRGGGQLFENVGPGKAKEYSIIDDPPHKKRSDILVMTIKDVISVD